MTIHEKDPDALLDYTVSWVDWLAEGETISTVEAFAEEGLTLATPAAESGGVVTVWLSGGTVGRTYRVTVRVATSAGRVDDRSFGVTVRER